MLERRETYHQYIHFGLLCVLAAAIPFSMFLMSISLILLSLNWFVRGRFVEKFGNKRNNIILGVTLILYVVHFVWLINTENFTYALHDIRIKLPLFALPFILFTSPILTEKQEKFLLFIYVLSVFLVSFVVFYRALQMPLLNYREFVPGISHIRYCLNVCFAMFVILLNLKYVSSISRYLGVFSFIAILWLFFILLILHSYTGLIAFFVSLFLLFLSKIILSKNRRVKFVCSFTIVLMAIGIASVCIYQYKAYYNLKPLSVQQMPTHTKAGNLYDTNNSEMIEDGNFIYHYICELELKEAWGKRSLKKIETPVEEWNLQAVLIRYLNSKGLTKDAEGVQSLTEKDIQNVENGIPNISYANRFGVRKLFSKFFFQFENYSVSNHTKGSSIFQRVELWSIGLQIVKQHFWWGVGTGDTPDAVKKQMNIENSGLKNLNLRCHNQYLTFAITFGIFGFAFVLFSLFWGTFKTNLCSKNNLFLVFFSIALLSMCTEDTLETQAGVTFFSFFFAYFLSKASQEKYGKIVLNQLKRK